MVLLTIKKIIKAIIAYKIAESLLIIMFVLAISSVWNDSAIMDEGPHISAGYSYLKYKDMRLNPEHPPLIKDLAALPLLFLKLNFPINSDAWQKNVNDQWTIGPLFLYQSGNNPDQILFYARLGPILTMLLLGFLLFYFTKKYFNYKTAILTLILFAFSPIILAHGRYVTTDVAASFGFLIGIFYFLKFIFALNNYSQETNHTFPKKELIYAGIIFGIAQLTKFSVFLLVPFLTLLTFVALIIWGRKKILVNIVKYFGSLILIFIIGYFLVGIFYAVHIWNYPLEKQVNDTKFILTSFPIDFIKDIVIKMAENPILRPWAEYGLGLLMVGQRTGGGNTTYFLGEVSSTSWWYYFPLIYLMKESLPILVLLFLTLLVSLYQIIRYKFLIARFYFWIKENFVSFSILTFVIIYWLISITSNLNIGVRHLIPTLPFLYILISKKTLDIISRKSIEWSPSILINIKLIIGLFLKQWLKYFILVILIFWHIWSTIFAWPYFLSYFNNLIGSENGYKYVVDSNVDWGQDLKRLAKFVANNHISQIKVDYFGSGSPEYYLGDAFIPWQSNRGKTTGWLAISATVYQTSKEHPETSYAWLDNYKPVTIIGNSILVFNINNR